MKSLSLCATAALCAGGLLWWQLAPTPSPQFETTLPAPLLPQQQIALRLSEVDVWALDPTHPLLEQRIDADLFLLPQPQQWQGQLRNIRVQLQGRSLQLPNPLYFEVPVSNGLFGAIQWLGLPATHPLRRLDFWLAELGGSNAELGSVTSIEGTRHYRYQPRGHWQTRRLLEQPCWHLATSAHGRSMGAAFGRPAENPATELSYLMATQRSTSVTAGPNSTVKRGSHCRASALARLDLSA